MHWQRVMPGDDHALSDDARDARRMRRLAIGLTAAFWLFNFLVQGAGVIAIGVSETAALRMISARFGGCVVGFLLCCLVLAIVARLRAQPFWVQVSVIALLGLPAGFLYLEAERNTLFLLTGGSLGNLPEVEPYIYVARVIHWIYVFVAWAVCVLALGHSLDARREQRLRAAAQQLAHDAQMRALRYQLNPHFLFNTLNSIVALIDRGQAPTASAMIQNLSDFLRTGLALDPIDDIPLWRELEIQRRYLDIELLRFPDRLNVEIDLGDALRDALVPSLIIQPLVENAVKYAVAKSETAVTLRIVARAEGGRLRLTVSDSGGDGRIAAPGAGTGVGLANIAGRLRSRFGEEGRFSAEAEPGGGFTAVIEMPLTRAA